MRSIARTLLLSTLVLGCAAEDEDLIFEDGKDDSFAAALKHGWLAFDGWAGGRVTEREMIHQWKFELTDSSQVELATHDSDVDTAMYLYKRGTHGRWGYPIARNDDADGGPGSALVRTLGKGEYRVIVKSKDPEGNISLVSSCSGDGCPEGEAACRFDAYIDAAPPEAPLTQGCLRELERVVNGEAEAHHTETSYMARRGTLATWQRRALEITARGECATDVFQPFELVTHQTPPNQTGIGALVSIDTDTDSGFTRWIALSHGSVPLVELEWLHDSAAFSWLCPADGTPQITRAVDEYCISSFLMQGSINADADSVVLGSQAGGDGGEPVPALVQAVVAHHQGTASSTPMYDYRAWSTEHGDAVRVTIGGVTYAAGSQGGEDARIYVKLTASGAEMPCLDL